jgi:hypothetical protein
MSTEVEVFRVRSRHPSCSRSRARRFPRRAKQKPAKAVTSRPPHRTAITAARIPSPLPVSGFLSGFGTPDWQDLGRRLLRERGAVVLLPRTPPAAGKTYTVSATINGTASMWSFEVR